MRGFVRGFLAFLVAGCVIGTAQEVSAQQLLTFNEIGDPVGGPILGEVVCSAGTGLRFTSDHFHVFGPATGAPFTSSGSTHLGFESGRGFPITMSRDGAGTFSLYSLDAGEFYYPPDPDRPDAQWITLTGTQAGGGVVTHTFFLDGLRDGPGGIADYEHFVLPPTFVNLRSVVFNGWLPGNIAGGLAFDNLQYQLDSPGSVPPCFYIDSVPTVSFVSPGSVVSGIATVQANATDNAAIASVTFKLNGVEMAPSDTTAPYSLQWDTTLVADGAYTLTAEARDFTNNAAVATLNVTVQNDVVVGNDPHYVVFDGVDDVVRVADVPALSFGNGTADTPMTIEAWVRPQSVGGRQQIIGKAGEYRVAFTYGTVLVELRDSSTGARTIVYTGVDLSGWVGSWHHVAVTYDGRGGATAGNGVIIYLDGVAVPVTRENNAAYVAMENLANTIDIGRDTVDNRDEYAGSLDELRLWNVVRTANQIQLTMGAELTGIEAGLVGYWRFNEGAGLASADDSPNNNGAALMNGTAWLPDGPLAPDTTAPQISNILVSNVTAGGATITFTTDEPASAWVSYTQTTCPCTDVYSATVGTTHTVQLSGLTAQTLYHFTVHASDGGNNVRTSASMNFTTAAASSDTQPPTVAFVTPVSGIVSGPVTITASASDNVGVVSVEFKLDGVSLGAPDTLAPYTLVWPSTSVTDGPHTITADARDAANHVSTATVMVLVQNTSVPNAPHYVAFDGVDDVVRIADAPALSFGNGTTDTPFTIEAWVRPDSVAGRQQIIGKSSEYRIAFTYGTVLLELRDNSTGARIFVYTNVDLSGWVGSWHHVAVAYDGRGGGTAGNGVTIYLDGVAAAVTRENNAAYVALENLTNPVDIGRDNVDGRDSYAGGLDELRLWNVNRTANAIQAARSAELTGVEAGLVGYWRFNEGLGTSVADDSPGSSTATLMNGTQWRNDGPLAADTTAPQISNIVVSNVTPTGATITFTTNEPATGWISYVAGAACPCIDAFSAGIGTAHTITLTGLASSTQYQFTAKAHDAANNQQAAAPINFTTLAASADVTAPVVSLTSPTGGTVAGSVSLQATASDNVGVTSVTFKVDGAVVGAPDTTAPYAVQWNTTGVSDGPHTISVEGRDAANNLGTTSVMVLVQNTPVANTPHYVAFDGIDDVVRVADAPALSFGNGTTDTPFTIEAWVRADSVAGRQQIIGKSNEYRVAFTYGTVLVELRDNSVGARTFIYTNVDLSGWVGSWHHVAVAYDGRGGATAGNGVTIYLDGVAAAVTRENNAAYVALENLTNPVDIGRDNVDGRDSYAGGLDELRLWNVQRSQPQILSAMSAELSGIESGLVGYWRFNEGAGTTVADDSPGSSTATLMNGTQWRNDGPLAADTTAPQISNIVVSNVTPTGATIAFTTNEPATGWISYVAGAACPCIDAFSAGIGTAHTITLTGLASSTQYQFTAKAHDAANNQQAAAPINFTTLAASADVTAPVVSLTSPTGGTVAGSIQLQATASDNVGVTNVTFKVDGVVVGAPDTTAPYAVQWNTTGVSDGPHTISAEGRDAANNLGTTSVMVLVQNAPTVLTPHYVAFGGVNDVVRVADAPALSFGNGTTDTPFTIEAWVRPQSVGGRQQIIGKASEYRVAFTYGTVLVELRDNSVGARTFVYTNVDLSGWVGSWHHVAVAYDGRGGATAGNGVIIYLDGVAVSVTRENNAAYVALENLTNPIDIGYDVVDGRDAYAGALDELRLWNVQRTQPQILSTMSAELSGIESGLVGYWRFNEGAGTTVADDSPNTSVATLSNVALWRVGGAF